jgi:hypothetical protein
MHKLVWIGLCTTAFLYVSCSKEVSQSQETVNLSSYYPAPSQSCIEPSRIIYHNTLDPAPLSTNQLDELSKFVCDTKPNDVWFVRVLYNRQEILRAEIFFLPEISTSRMRKGKCAYYDSQFYAFPKEYLDTQEVIDAKGFNPKYYDYVQVLPEIYFSVVESEIPFDDYMLPFSASDDFSDQEIIDIVDFIRGERAEKTERHFRIDRTLPIMSITEHEDTIVIRTGTLEGPEMGMGQEIHLKKIDDRYSIIKVMEWVS